AGCVGCERIPTSRRVPGAAFVPAERPRTVADIGITRCVGGERSRTGGRVLPTLCVGQERIATGGRIAISNCVVLERRSTDGRVIKGGPRRVHERVVTNGRVADGVM